MPARGKPSPRQTPQDAARGSLHRAQILPTLSAIQCRHLGLLKNDRQRHPVWKCASYRALFGTRLEAVSARVHTWIAARKACRRAPFYGLESFSVSTGRRGAGPAGAFGVPHASRAAMAFLASAIVSSHAAGSAIDLHPPPLLTRANALRAFSSAAPGEPLSEISAATLNALPAGVTTQSGQAGFARAPVATKIKKRPAAGQRRSHNLGE